ncbi:hypothetical protein PS467_24610 [Streptomyces luomodiensis]|uniref:Uncharacterized protein n=1 Tax=Streptomyces luomodiensis TaxID=3026192 RepID=A0ABY9V0X0_9ACTN|nr:hypothetical protein [Streptomyces sp. SCA4-21]WNE98281.1 hypothetical protein PS467_24610 [Streptomyces sp. SCA4-21]
MPAIAVASFKGAAVAVASSYLAVALVAPMAASVVAFTGADSGEGYR